MRWFSTKRGQPPGSNTTIVATVKPAPHKKNTGVKNWYRDNRSEVIIVPLKAQGNSPLAKRALPRASQWPHSHPHQQDALVNPPASITTSADAASPPAMQRSM